MWRSSSRGAAFPFFVGTWLAVTFVAVLFVVRYGFQFSGLKPFFGCHTVSYRDSAGSYGDPSHPRGDM